MKIFLIAFIGLLSAAGVFAQTESPEAIAEKQEYELYLTNTLKTMVIDLDGIDLNVQGELKDTFLTYKERIVSVLYDETTQRMTITHNYHLNKDDLTGIFQEFNLDSSVIIFYK